MAQKATTNGGQSGTQLGASRALQTVLEGLTRVYNNGEKLDVTVDPTGGESYIEPDGSITISTDHSHVGQSLSKSEHFRIANSDVSHETEHYRQTDLDGIATFSKQYPACRRLASSVWNITEDVYIDEQRFQRRPKLRSVTAWYGALMAENDALWSPVDEIADNSPVQAVSSGLVQIKWIGTPKGFSRLSDSGTEGDVRAVLASVREKLETAKNTHKQEDRTALAHAIMDEILDTFPRDEWDDAESLLDELMKALMSLDPEQLPDDMGGDPDPRRTPEGEGTADGPAGDRSDAETSEDAPDRKGGDVEADMDRTDPEASDDGADTSTKEWQDIDEDTDLDEAAEEATEDREERFNEREQRDENPMRKRMHERNDVIQRSDAERVNPDSDAKGRELERYARRTGMIDEIEKEFQDLRSKPSARSARSGSRAHKGNIVRHAAGNKSVRKLSKRRTVSSFGGRAVSFALDGSGSMDKDHDTESDYTRLEEAKLALGALATAISEMGDNVMGTCFDNPRDPRLVTAPDEDFEWQHLDGVDMTAGSTPMAAGVDDAADLLDGVNAQQRALFVLCDGGASNMWATEEAVKEARRDGIDVIGVGFGGVLRSDMDRMFGDNYVITSPSTLAEDVVGKYRDMIDG